MTKVVEAQVGSPGGDSRLAERLAATDPTNTEWLRDLSVSHERMGDLARASGDLDAARTAYQACLAIAERLAATDPTNTQWQRDLSASRERTQSLDAAASGDHADSPETNDSNT